MQSKPHPRITKELEQIISNRPNGWKIIKQSERDWDCWITILGSCPYSDIPFLLKIHFPDDYPFQKPSFKLEKPELFFHPNISGSICLSILKDQKQYGLRARQMIESFIFVLHHPNPQSPLNGAAAQLYLKDRRTYYRKARDVFQGIEKM